MKNNLTDNMICLLPLALIIWNEDSTEKSVTSPTSCQYQHANQRFRESMTWIARAILTSSFNYFQAKGWCMFGYHQVERNIEHSSQIFKMWASHPEQQNLNFWHWRHCVGSPPSFPSMSHPLMLLCVCGIACQKRHATPTFLILAS